MKNVQVVCFRLKNYGNELTKSNYKYRRKFTDMCRHGDNREKK